MGTCATAINEADRAYPVPVYKQHAARTRLNGVEIFSKSHGQFAPVVFESHSLQAIRREDIPVVRNVQIQPAPIFGRIVMVDKRTMSQAQIDPDLRHELAQCVKMLGVIFDNGHCSAKQLRHRIVLRGRTRRVVSGCRPLLASPEPDVESVNGIGDAPWAIQIANGGLDLLVTRFLQCGGQLHKVSFDTYPPAPVTF